MIYRCYNFCSPTWSSLRTSFEWSSSITASELPWLCSHGAAAAQLYLSLEVADDFPCTEVPSTSFEAFYFRFVKSHPGLIGWRIPTTEPRRLRCGAEHVKTQQVVCYAASKNMGQYLPSSWKEQNSDYHIGRHRSLFHTVLTSDVSSSWNTQNIKVVCICLIDTSYLVHLNRLRLGFSFDLATSRSQT